MIQAVVHIALVVKDYDKAIDFYTKKLHFELVEDTFQPDQNKRWVVVAPLGSNGALFCLQRLQNQNRNHSLVTRLEDEYFCF